MLIHTFIKYWLQIGKTWQYLIKVSYVTVESAVSAHSTAGLILASVMDVIWVLVLLTAIMTYFRWKKFRLKLQVDSYRWDIGVSYLKYLWQHCNLECSSNKVSPKSGPRPRTETVIMWSPWTTLYWNPYA